MRQRLTALVGIAVLASLATPDSSHSCTPLAISYPTWDAQVAAENELANKLASPLLANSITSAADISVVKVTAIEPAPLSDVPDNYLDTVKYNPDLSPVRYKFTVVRTLKGSPPQTIPFKFEPSRIDAERTWTVRPNYSFRSFSNSRSSQAFWHDGRLFIGSFSGGPGDCSNQIAFDPDLEYLLIRDADGDVATAEPISANDPLPNLISNFLSIEESEYLWRPALSEYLKLAGGVWKVKVLDCRTNKLEILEELRPRPDGPGMDVGGEERLYTLAPSFRVNSCRPGDEYIMTGWPGAARLHSIQGQFVRFEDQWMQLRFSGATSMSLDELKSALR